MSTFFAVFCGLAGFFFLNRFLKNDFDKFVLRSGNAFNASTPTSTEKPVLKVVDNKNNENKTEHPKPVPYHEGTLDDFTLFDGIGPKIDKLLKQHGIHTYRQLGQFDTARLSAILVKNKIRVRHTDPAAWKKQAAFSAEGNWDALDRFQLQQKMTRQKKLAAAA